MSIEPTELLHVELSYPVNVAIGGGQGNGVITNDDIGPFTSIGDVTLAEGDAGTTSSAPS